MSAPEVGQPWSWVPTAFSAFSDKTLGILGATTRVNGRIIYVNEEHNWFRAEATFAGGTIRECFPITGAEM